MKKGYIIIIFIILFITSLFLVVIMNKSLFLLKNVEVSKDFDLDRERLLKYLDIYPVKSIWEYNTKLMEKKLSRHYYLGEYKVAKRYPSTLFVKLTLREPVAKVVGMNGELFAVDKEGVVFKEMREVKEHSPVLIYTNRDKIKAGIKINGAYMDIIDFLFLCKKRFPDVYKALSQIEVRAGSKYTLDYIINFKTFCQRIYLKNKIDVDSLRRGLCCLLFLNSKDYDKKDVLYYTESGFAIL